MLIDSYRHSHTLLDKRIHVKMWAVSICIRNITTGHTCHEQQSTDILPEYVDTCRIDRVDYWQYEKVYKAGCLGVKQYGKPGASRYPQARRGDLESVEERAC